MTRLTALGTVIGATLLGVLGCGQKGPLYLPDHNGAVVTRPAGASPNTQPAGQQPAQTPPSGAPPSGTNGTPAKKRTDKDDDSVSPK